MKKRITVLGLLLALCLPVSAWAGDDLSKGEILKILMQTAPKYTSYISEEDIVSGYNEGDFRDDKLATDTEMLVMISRAFPSMEKPKGNNYITLPEKAELGELPQWAQAHFEYLNNRGIISSSLELDDSVTMPELEKYLKRVWRYYGGNLNDDFYATVNRASFSAARPGIDVYTNRFSSAAHTSNRLVRDLIYEIVKKDNLDEREQKVKDIYTASVAMQRGTGDMSPLKPYLKKIDDAKDLKELSAALLYCNKEIYMTGLVNFDLASDPKAADRYIPVIDVSEPSFQQEDYKTDTYKKDFLEYVGTVLTIAGESRTDALAAAKRIYKLEKAVSPHCLTQYDLTNVEKTYNIMTLKELGQWFDYLDLEAIAKTDGLELGPDDKILVPDPGLVYNMAAGCKGDLRTAKDIAKTNIAIQFGGTLSKDCIKAGDQYEANVSGLPYVPLSVQEKAVAVTKNYMSDYLSILYCEKYFPDEDKAGIEEITNDIKDVYRNKIQECTWMSDKTKEKALKKLNNMSVKIGYSPSSYDYMENVSVKSGDSLFDITLELLKAYNEYKGRVLGEPYDRESWPCAAYDTNAFYYAMQNEMVLPAGILQAPFYSPDADFEENMAGIGFVIAHEMSHAFDSSGAYFNEIGSYQNWWTEEDKRKFAEKCSDIAAFYDGVEAVTDVMTNGRLTIGEDIADLGGIACASEIVKRTEAADMKKFYCAFADIWAEVAARDYIEYANRTDEHPSANIRVNLCLENTNDFVETFGITEGDGMYVPENERVGLW